MKHQQAKRIFFNWLKERNVYEQYKYYRHLNNTHKRSIFYRSSMLSPTVYIIDAFAWDSTTQGFDFWDSLHGQWVEHFANLNEDPRYN